nr:hypothetical protein [Tanacetum cinerariifolium]
MICYGQLITKMAKKMRLLIDKIDPEDPAPGVPLVAIPRGPRPSVKDLYDRMGSMEIRQGAIKRMAYRKHITRTGKFQDGEEKDEYCKK